MTIYGDGSQTRSFQYVHDLVDGLMATMNANLTHFINIGNPDEFTIADFPALIKKINSKSAIVKLSATTDDLTQRKPDISRAAKELGRKPRFTLDQGLDETVIE